MANNPADKHLVDLVLLGDTRAFGTIINNTEGLVAEIVFKLIPVNKIADLNQLYFIKPGMRAVNYLIKGLREHS